MKGWIIYRHKDAIRNKEYIKMHIQEGKLINIEFTLIIVEKMKFGIENNNWFIKVDETILEKPDFVISRMIFPLLSRQLEYMGIRVFNNSKVAEICNDKAKTYQYVASLGISMVDTIFCENNLINNRDYLNKEILEINDLDIDNLENNIGDRIEPIKRRVLKTVDGHGGNQVFLLENRLNSSESEKIIKNIGKSDFVVQPLIGRLSKDLRVYVINKTIIAAVLRTASTGFKSNYSLGGKVEQYNLNNEEVLLVNKIINLFDFGLVGIDFIIGDNGQLIFNEIEDVVGSRMLYQCTDVNIVKLYLEYIRDNLFS